MSWANRCEPTVYRDVGPEVIGFSRCLQGVKTVLFVSG